MSCRHTSTFAWLVLYLSLAASDRIQLCLLCSPEKFNSFLKPTHLKFEWMAPPTPPRKQEAPSVVAAARGTTPMPLSLPSTPLLLPPGKKVSGGAFTMALSSQESPSPPRLQPPGETWCRERGSHHHLGSWRELSPTAAINATASSGPGTLSVTLLPWGKAQCLWKTEAELNQPQGHQEANPSRATWVTALRFIQTSD